MTRSRIVDVAIAATLCTAALTVGTRAATALRTAPARAEYSGFSQRVYGAALMRACGYGAVTPSESAAGSAPGDVVAEFVAGRRTAITCADAAGVPAEQLDGLQRASRYLIELVAAPWALFGPSWNAIDRLLGAMFATTIGLAFVACRLTMRRVAAAVAAGLFMLSPLHLAHLVDLRDYAKAPFFLLALAVIALLTTRSLPQRALIGVTTVAGGLFGIGFGMRTDVAINVALLTGVVLVFLPGGFRRTARTRLLAAAGCAVAFWVVSLPLVSSFETRSSPWHVFLLGFARDWDAALGVSETLYETGYFYDDSYVGTLVDAYWGRTHDGVQKVAVGLPGYAEASRAYLVSLLSTFPADMAARTLAAVVRVLQLPFSGVTAVDPSIVHAPVATASTITQGFLTRLESVSLAGFFLIAVGISRWCLRRATLVVVLALSLGGYPALQFQPRHIFHLEIVGLWALLFAVSALTVTVSGGLRQGEWLRPFTRPWRPLVFAATVILVVTMPIAALRAYQQPKVAGLIDDYSSAPFDTVATDTGNDVAGRSQLFTEPRGPRSMYSELLVVDIGEGCQLPSVAVTFRYQPNDLLNDLSRTWEVDVPHSGVTRLFVPVFETGAVTPEAHRLRFEGIGVAHDERGCVLRLGKARRPDQFGLLLPVVVAPNWQTLPLYEQLRDWEELPSLPMQTSYWSPPTLSEQRGSVLKSAGEALPFEGQLEYQSGIANVASGSVKIDGRADSAGSYVVAWNARPFDASDVVVSEGRIDRGGLSIGLVDAAGWGAKVDISTPGRFRAALRPNRTGNYQLVIANHLQGSSRHTRAEVARVSVARGIPAGSVAQ